MIHGSGIDIVSIARVREISDSHGSRFAAKILSENEMRILPEKTPYQFLAGRFAAKEALFKALGGRTVRFTDIEVLNNEEGKPYVSNVELFRAALGIGAETPLHIHLSISHEREYAVASAIIELA